MLEDAKRLRNLLISTIKVECEPILQVTNVFLNFFFLLQVLKHSGNEGGAAYTPLEATFDKVISIIVAT